MIDLKQYQGHTEGGWYVNNAPDVIHPTVIHSNKYDTIVAESLAITGEWTKEDYANARLIADAPKLLAEVKRLREGIKQIARDYDFNAIKSQSRHCARPAYNVPAGDGIHTVTFHQKACLKIMELIE